MRKNIKLEQILEQISGRSISNPDINNNFDLGKLLSKEPQFQELQKKAIENRSEAFENYIIEKTKKKSFNDNIKILFLAYFYSLHLALAVKSKNKDIVDWERKFLILLKHNFSPDFLLSSSQLDLPTLKLILQIEKNCNLELNGYTPLHAAVAKFEHFTYQEHIQLLLNHGININGCYKFGTALHLAIVNEYWNNEGKRSLVDFLITEFKQRKFDWNLRDWEGKTVLILAAKMRDTDIAIQLIDIGVDVHAQDKQGKTALHYAALLGDIVTVEKLIKAHANVNQKDNENKGCCY